MNVDLAVRTFVQNAERFNFNAQGLARILRLRESECHRALDRLVAEGVLQKRATPSGDMYFKGREIEGYE